MTFILTTIVTAATLLTTTAVYAADASKTINRFAELNLSLGYNDGSSISLKLQEYRGPYNPELFKIYKDTNDELTGKRPAIQEELDKMGNSLERNIANQDCKKTLIDLKTASRGLGMIKGMHSISSTNEESRSRSAAQQSLEELQDDLKFKALSACKKSIETEIPDILN